LTKNIRTHAENLADSDYGIREHPVAKVCKTLQGPKQSMAPTAIDGTVEAINKIINEATYNACTGQQQRKQ
jgi:hypothetical protein